MDTISVSYTLKWQYKPLPYYQWSKCGKLFNTRTGRELKKVYNAGSVGYWIKGKFVTLSNLKRQIEIIKNINSLIPF